jgi:hypothetical protein
MTRRMGPTVRAASRFALSWAGWYTRDLEPTTASERRDEIASDVWEQVAGQADRPAAALAASIVSRVVRGIPADLAWRWRMPAQPRAVRQPAAVRAALVVAMVVAGSSLALGTAALVRVGIGLARAEALPSVTTVTSVALGVAGLLAGFALLRRGRTRRLALIWLAGATGVTLHFASLTMVTLSPTFQVPYIRLIMVSGQGWLPWWFLIVGAIAAFPALVAVTIETAPRSAR